MNILLTSAGRRSYLVQYFKETLTGKGNVHASNSEWSTALEIADEAVLTPLIYDDGYISFLLDYCKKNRIEVIISLFDIDLPVLAKAKERFRKQGIHVIVSDHEVTQICNDKWKTYNFLIRNNLNTPKSFISLEETEHALSANIIQFPLIIKPRWGMGSISIFNAENLEELHVLYKKVNSEVQESYLRFESETDSDHSILIQEYLCGQEYGLDVICDLDKNYKTTFVKKKISMRSGETDRAVTIQSETLEITGKKIAGALKHIANLDVDCFMINNEPYILEMNCRFGGGYPFSHLAGADLPATIMNWVQGKESAREMLMIEPGIEGSKDISLLKKQLVMD